MRPRRCNIGTLGGPMKQIAKAGRNDPCPCGSGLKFKKCCEPKIAARQGRSSLLMMLLVGAAVAGAIAAGIASFNSDSSSSGMKVWSPEHGHYHDANGVA